MGSGFKDFAINEVLASADVDNYLMKQSVMCFDSAAARNAAITSPEEGMVTYLRDEDYFEARTGTSWTVWDPRPPVAILRQNNPVAGNPNGQDIPRETDTAVIWNFEALDTHNGHDNSTNPTRYTVPRSGIYRVSVNIPMAASTYSGKLEAFVKRSDGLELSGIAMYKHGGATTPVLTFTRLLQMSAGMWIEIMLWHNVVDGASSIINLLPTQPGYKVGPSLDVEWVRP